MSKYTLDPIIYVASLADYNAGVLHGAWIDVVDYDNVMREIEEMLASSPTAKREGRPAEEWAIHDHEGFGPFKPSEYENLEELCELVENAEKYGDAYLAYFDNNHNRDVRSFQEDYLGEWKDIADYAYEFHTETMETISDEHPLVNYIDWEHIGEDMERNGDIFTLDNPEGGVWVFRNN